MASSSGKERSSGSKIRAARLSSAQFEVLIQFMRQHPHFAVGRSTSAGGGYWSYSKEEHDRLWRTITSMLNDTEGPVKSVNKWQKCWVDLKSNARSRAAKFRALPRDGPQPAGSMFTQWDEQVLSLLSEITANNENNFAPVVSQTPIQLVEVGFSEKTIQNQNGFHDSEDGALTSESVNSHELNSLHGLHASEEDDAEELLRTVKSEREDWTENDDAEDYSADSIMPESEPGLHSPHRLHLQPGRHFPSNGTVHISHVPTDEFSRESSHHRQNKRKLSDPTIFLDHDDSIERFSKKICGALERMASAVEEANTIQQGMVNAMSRIASSFEQFLPVVAKILSKNSDLPGPV